MRLAFGVTRRISCERGASIAKLESGLWPRLIALARDGFIGVAVDNLTPVAF